MSKTKTDSEIILLPSDEIESITCNKCCDDHYEVENLLVSTSIDRSTPKVYTFGTHPSTSNRGFKVASFVRPPVSVKIRFRRSIDLQAIHLGLSVGIQKTLAFQIFVGDTDDDRAEIERRVATIYFANTDICPNEFFISRRNNGMTKKGDGGIDYFTKSYLLDRVKTLTIKITKAYYIPCLEFVKIFVKDSVGKFGCAASDQRSSIDIGDRSESESVSGETKQIAAISKPISDQITIPKEFFDPITNSCMSLPIILPSGHTIDRSTLEKYLEEEARYGRPANDPFTSVRFSDSSSPIPNNRLKERIDKFFLTYPDLAKEEDYGRTLCGGGEYSATLGGRKVVVMKKTGIREASDKALSTQAKSATENPAYLRNILPGLPSFL